MNRLTSVTAASAPPYPRLATVLPDAWRGEHALFLSATEPHVAIGYVKRRAVAHVLGGEHVQVAQAEIVWKVTGQARRNRRDSGRCEARHRVRYRRAREIVLDASGQLHIGQPLT
jgi:hypothetical protein